jgi:large subunit ribosomal protein L23
MADEKKVAAKATEAPKEVKKAEAPKAKKAEAPKAEAKKVVYADPIAHDYEVILTPVITEKSMALLQNANRVTVKVSDKANKTEIKESFQRLYKASVSDVKVLTKRAKETSRGGHKGVTSGYKKAIVTLKEGSAIDLFKE